jgi:hypothetical protein
MRITPKLLIAWNNATRSNLDQTILILWYKQEIREGIWSTSQISKIRVNIDYQVIHPLKCNARIDNVEFFGRGR